jgi:lipopolysaccharide biosynthesis regulator YciM
MVDCLLELKRPADAIPHLRRVLEKAPHYRDRAATSLAQCLNRVGASAQALTELAPLAQMKLSPPFHYAYAELLIKERKVDDAKAILQRLIREAPLHSRQDRQVAAQAKKLLAAFREKSRGIGGHL